MAHDVSKPILFIQLRKDLDICVHEAESLLKCSRLPRASFLMLNAVEQPIGLSLLDKVRAIVIGGSGDFLVSQGDIPDVVAKVSELVHQARRQQMPILGICFGGQMMTVAFGGTVEKDEARQEIGTFVTTRTPESDQCPIFSRLPHVFDAQYGHKDHLTKLPDGAVLLASTELSPLVAFTFPGEPLYALVMHPELDQDAMAFRLSHYRDKYGVTQDVYDRIMSDFRPSPEVSQLVRLFLTEVVEKGKRYPRD